MNVVIFLLMLGLTLIYSAPTPMTMDEAKSIIEDIDLMNGKKISELSKNELENAVKQLQQKFEVPVTGKLDKATIEYLSRPRCGTLNKNNAQTRERKWDKSEITYKFINYPRNKLDRTKSIKTMTEAFEVWSKHIPIKFTLKKSGRVDIDITFEKASEGDGPGKTVAYAYFPTAGDIVFDEENWTIKTGNGIDLFLTSVHEIGHSIGLRHSEYKDSIMFPYIISYKPTFGLHFTDVINIQKLYGSSTESCLTENVDALLAPTSNLLYAIKGDQYWKFIDRKLQKNYPKSLSSKWPSLEVSSVDSAFYYDNAYYFISGKNVYIYKNNKLTKEKLKESITKIDAAVTLQSRIYYFTGSSYRKYIKTNNGMEIENGFPRPISIFWLGIPNDLDAAYMEKEEDFHFFKGDTVYTFNIIDKHKIAKQQKISEFLQCN